MNLVELFSSTEKSERQKYETCWNDQQYRNAPKSERRIEMVAQHFQQFKAKKLIDLGVGTGRLAHLLQEKGFEVTGVDIASNCLDEDVHIELIQQPLWEPIMGLYDGVICTDTLEHIPTNKVKAVIDNIQRLAPHGYIAIGLNKEKLNPTGKPLHLTLKPASWWNEMITFAEVGKTLKGDHAVARY